MIVSRMRKKIRILSVLAFMVMVFMGTGCGSDDTGQAETPTPSGQAQTDTASTSIQPPAQAGTPQPPGDPPPGKVWSPEHGHWHTAPSAADTLGGTPQPPGDPPPGKVWSEAHGHWHNAPADQGGADTVNTGTP
jgi:hypothetical protein